MSTPMDRDEVEAALAAAERAVAEGRGLAGTGFWRAVAAVKARPELVDATADRIARIDEQAFALWARLRIPLALGTALAVSGTVVGLLLVLAAFPLDPPWDGAALLAGTGALLGTTHGLGHLVVGRWCGIRFTAWFIGPKRPQPGVKVDYATYLRTPPRCRAWMHAAGAIVTKLVPFVGLVVGWAASVRGWAMAVLAVVAVVQIVTDVTLSTRSGDWAKFRRELRYAG